MQNRCYTDTEQQGRERLGEVSGELRSKLHHARLFEAAREEIKAAARNHFADRCAAEHTYRQWKEGRGCLPMTLGIPMASKPECAVGRQQ